MRWYTHSTLALAAGAALGLNVAALVGVGIGSVLPDRVDMFVAGKDRRLFQRIHRESSHWAGWFFLLLIGAQLFAGSLDSGFLTSRSLGFPAQLLLSDLLSGVALGALSHVILDALNPSGVPLSPLGGKPRLALNLLSTGTWKETVFLAASLLCLGALGRHNLEPLLRQLLQSL